MADSVRHKTLLSILDALLIVGAAGAVATGGASLVVLGGAAFIASITKRFRALPADEKEILRGVTTAQLRDALMQVGLGTEHAAAAHAGVLRIEEQITSLREAMGKIAEDGRHDGDREIARRLAGQLDELHEAAERAQKSLSRIERVLTAGLVSVSDFEERYWDNTLGSLPLDRIRKDPEKVKLLKSVFAGRNRELFQLAGFLTDATSQTMHIHGSPGNGKSRLVLEIAHRAQAVGWIVLFVDSAISDFALHAALETVRNVLREAEPAHVLLVWDDYQGENQDQLRTFLRLHTSPEMWSPFKGQTVGESHTPLRVKRLVTSWLAFSGAVAQHADPKDVTWAKGMELPPLRADDTMGITAFVDLMCELGDDTQFTREDMEQLLVQAEGHPQVALLGVDLLLGGEPLTAALNRPSILRSSYGRVVKRLMDELDGEHLEAFRTLAFIQRCSRDSLEWFAIGANCDQFLKQLGRLREAGFVRRDNDKTYFVYPDIQRMYMCTASFEPDGPLGGLDAPPADIAAQLRPFIPVWLPPIWSLVQSALPPDGEQIAEIKDRLLTIAEEAIGQSTSGEKTHQRDEQWSRAMFAMTVIEAIPRDRRQWARMIGVIANRHESPSTKIDLEWVRALFNATAGETDPNVCREIAREIGVIANRHEPPSAEIDLRWAKALCSATVGQPDPNVCREIAREISVIADRHKPPSVEIDLAWAQALYNATAVEPDPNVRREIAGEISVIADRHEQPSTEIDLPWAEALCNATVGQPDPNVCREIVGEISVIADRHEPPNAEIDRRWAKALFNATAVEPDPNVCREIAREIGVIADRHEQPSAEIDLEWAKALCNATAVEPDPNLRREIAGEIGVIADRHEPPNAEIDRRWAKALYNATAVEPDPNLRREITGEIGVIADRHEQPNAEIDLEWAKALQNATAVEPDPNTCREIAGEIGVIAVRHEPPNAEIDSRWAAVLANAATGVNKHRTLAEIDAEITAVAARHEMCITGIDDAWLRLLMYWAGHVERDDALRAELIERFKGVARRHLARLPFLEQFAASPESAWPSGMAEDVKTAVRELVDEIPPGDGAERG